MNPTLRAGSINTSVYTSPHATPDLNPEPALLALIDSAKFTIDFSIYSLTLPSVAKSLIAAKQRGVAIKGVCDQGEAKGVTSQIPALLAAGLDILKWGGNYRLLHDKLMVVDGNQVALGSFNWTRQAEVSNVEVMVVLTGAQCGKVLAPTLIAQIMAARAAALNQPIGT